MPYLNIPLLCPINPVDKNRTMGAGYNFNHFDAWLASEQILTYEQKKCDAQIWEFNDICFLQVESDMSPIRVKVRDNRGLVVLQEIMDLAITLAGKYYYQCQIAFDDPVFADGGYFIPEITAGDNDEVVLECTAWNVQEKHYGSLLVKYQNFFNNEIIWETGIYMTFRFFGVIPFDKPGSVRTSYTDQPGSQVVVKGDAHRIFKLYVGTEGGVPPWKIDKMEEIINQNYTEYDGKPFAVISGATWAAKKLERYPYAQWNIEMRELVNRRYRRFEATGLQERQVTIDYNVSLKLFGPISGSANDNTVTINEVG